MVDIFALTNQSLGLSTLANATAVKCNTDWETWDHKVLMKKIDLVFSWTLHDVVDGGKIYAFLGTGAVSVGDLDNALVASVLQEGATSWAQIQGQVRTIWWETMTPLVPTGVGTQSLGRMRASLGGGKGIPVMETQGISIFVWNIGSALQTGSVLLSHGVGYGVSL